MPPDAHVLLGRFVVTSIYSLHNKVNYKARYVIYGHRNKLTDMMVHSSLTQQPQSIRPLLLLAAVFGFHFWTSDILKGYVQASEALEREVFNKRTTSEFEMSPEQCLNLLRPLYGLCEDGELWQITLGKHHLLLVRKKSFTTAPALSN